ncbi:MAG: hypothetical protein A2Z25_11020 [Planctomycetes bacterium RBG_16_55_9]|nr:MAG: hypothetical protein A2Z25_11020 [Planctomycetes bacterium RBG_16_55_9]
MLDYFFDGVPPLGQDPFEAGPFDPNAQQLDQTGQALIWYVHEPIKECTNCHRWPKRRGFSAETYLIAPVPKLCYNCHDDYTVKASFVHGPVAVGQCLVCHSDPPHKSRIEHLLKEPEPKLCYLCHDVSMIELIPAHLPGQTSACSDCHDPHSGSTKALLKSSSAETQAEQEKSTNEPPPREPAMTPEQREELGRRQREIADLYYRSMESYRKGEWTKARDGFVKVLKSGLIPAPMADMLRAHVVDIDNRLRKSTGPPETPTVTKPLN